MSQTQETQTTLPYSVLVSSDGLRWEVFDQEILGRDAALEVMRAAMKKAPRKFQWRVYQREVSDALLYGIRLGRRYAERFHPQEP